MPEAVRRVLLYRLGSLGDHLVALPAYRTAARMFPGAELRLLTNLPVASKAAAAQQLLDGSGLVHGYTHYAVGERSPVSLFRLAAEIRRWHPEVVVYLAAPRGLQRARRDALFFKLCGVRQIIGLPDSEQLQRSLLRGEQDGVQFFEQEGERLLRCLGQAGDVPQADWSPALTASERTQAVHLLQGLEQRPFFAISLGTKAQANEWGTDRWSALAARLASTYPDCGLVMVGALDEMAASEQVLAAWRAFPNAGPALNLCSGVSLRLSAAVLERALLFLGHDSGPAHLAASVQTPVVGIYSARMPPGQWFPHGEHVSVLMHWVDCGGCLLQACVVQGKKCIYSISVDEVFSAAQRHLHAVHARGLRGLPPSALREGGIQ